MSDRVQPAQEAPPVSVVVAAHNAAPHLRACLDSVLAQRGVDVELIVVDDGSTDETPDVIAGYGGRVRGLRQRCRGPSAARNRGAAAAGAPFVAFFDADDVMLQGKLAAQAEALRAAPDAACAVIDYRNFDDGVGTRPNTHFQSCPALSRLLGTPEPGAAVRLEGAQARALLVDENFATSGSLVFRREALDGLGGFDEAIHGGEDFELLYRGALAGPIVVVPRVGFHRRFHGGNLSSHAVHMLQHQAGTRAKLAALEPDPALARALRRASRVYRIALAEHLGRRGERRAALRALRGALPQLATRSGARALAWGVAGPFLHALRGRASPQPPA